MFDRFAEAARQTVFFARAEADGYGSRQIETEHFLLALLRESEGLLRQLLGNVATASALEHDVRRTLGIRVPLDKTMDRPLSHEVKRMLAFSGEAAERLNDRTIGTGHLLLGLLRESECAAARTLVQYGVTRERAEDALDAGGVLPDGTPPPAVVATKARLHELVDSLPEGAWQHAFGSLNYLQVWPPTPSEPARIAELREQMLERMQAGRHPGSFSTGGGGGSWSAGAGGQVQTGHYTSSWVEDGVRVSETHLFLEGRELTIVQRVRTTEDGRKAVISEQIRGPKGEQELSAEVDLF